MKKTVQPDEVGNSLVAEMFQDLRKSMDFIISFQESSNYYIAYFRTLIKPETLHQEILPYLIDAHDKNIHQLKDDIPIDSILISTDVEEITNKLLQGQVYIFFPSKNQGLVIPAPHRAKRNVTTTENEFSVLGPKEAFIEDLETNLNMLRIRVPDDRLRLKEIHVGSITKSRVVVAYLEGVTNPEFVETATQRLQDIDFDLITDSSMLNEILQDNTRSLFPQIFETERPDRAIGELCFGTVVIFFNGSSNALVGPVNIFRFFVSYDDYYLSAPLATFFRIIRFLGIAFSVIASALYVAVLTYHYELIPTDLLSTLIASRQDVPFPPIIEVIFLELTIELLREASARMPSKIGQTLGIVGGIVIGTASVEAALTSNILLILVALAALASFTIPVYRMSSTIRMLRYFFIFFAQLWGLVGIVFFFLGVIIHLLHLTSFGHPYLVPLYPLRLKDWHDGFIRLPYNFFRMRPSYSRSLNPWRMIKRESRLRKKDIEES